jgi:hypothetical protein
LSHPTSPVSLVLNKLIVDFQMLFFFLFSFLGIELRVTDFSNAIEELTRLSGETAQRKRACKVCMCKTLVSSPALQNSSLFQK